MLDEVKIFLPPSLLTTSRSLLAFRSPPSSSSSSFPFLRPISFSFPSRPYYGRFWCVLPPLARSSSSPLTLFADGSLGAFLVGTLFSTFLLGVTATQAFSAPHLSSCRTRANGGLALQHTS